MVPNDGFFPNPSLMFTIVPLIIAVGFAFVFGSLLVQGVRGAAQWQSDNAQPLQTLPARVVAKRSHVQGYGGHNGHGRTTTTYFATFEFSTGERREIKLPGETYGLLAEGDQGQVTVQGTRFQAWERALR